MGVGLGWIFSRVIPDCFCPRSILFGKLRFTVHATCQARWHKERRERQDRLGRCMRGWCLPDQCFLIHTTVWHQEVWEKMRQESASLWWLSTWQVYSYLGDTSLGMTEDFPCKWMVPFRRVRPGLNKDGVTRKLVCYSSRVREMLLSKVVGFHVMLWAPEASHTATKFGVFHARFWACFHLYFLAMPSFLL